MRGNASPGAWGTDDEDPDLLAMVESYEELQEVYVPALL